MKPVLFGVDVNWCFFQFFSKAVLRRIVKVVFLYIYINTSLVGIHAVHSLSSDC